MKGIVDYLPGCSVEVADNLAACRRPVPAITASTTATTTTSRVDIGANIVFLLGFTAQFTILKKKVGYSTVHTQREREEEKDSTWMDQLNCFQCRRHFGMTIFTRLPHCSKRQRSRGRFLLICSSF